MQLSNQPMTLMGSVSHLDVERKSFRLDCRDGSRVLVFVSRETKFVHLKNLDELERDRIRIPSSFKADDPDPEQLPQQLIKRYLRLGRLVVVQGLCGAGDDGVDLRCEAGTVNRKGESEGSEDQKRVDLRCEATGGARSTCSIRGRAGSP